MPITGCASPAASTGRSSPREPGVWVPGDAAGPLEKLRTLQTPLRSHGEYIWEGLGGAVLSWVQKQQGSSGTGQGQNEMEMGVDSEEGRWPGRGLEAKRAVQQWALAAPNTMSAGFQCIHLMF